MQKRSVATVIILTIITCGIYGLYWLYVTANALEQEGQTGGTSPAVMLVLTIIPGLSIVGYILFSLAADANLNAIKARRGLPQSDNQVVYIILSVIFPIVLIGLVQNEINKMTY